MKSYKTFSVIITFVLLLSIFSIISSKAFAKDITRSCHAHYVGTVESIELDRNGRSQKVGVPYETINFSFQDRDFSAEAGCGDLVPNRCRERAREKLLACAKAHVASPDKKPESCSNDVKRYSIQDLPPMIKEKACGALITRDQLRISDLLPRNYRISVMLGIFIDGDDDCGKKDPGTTTIDGNKYNIEGNKLFLKEPLKSFAVSCP
jgi:hypothetical protein